METYFFKKNYPCFHFNYPTRKNTIEKTAHMLDEWLQANEIKNADFICHSMGGLVSHAYFTNHYKNTDLSTNVICLGSPFRGSMVARSLRQTAYGRWLLGIQTNSQLINGVKNWPENSKLGVIAGSYNIGAGRVLGLDSTKPGDGTVLVEETGIGGMTDYIVLPVSHSQMTFSIQVFKQIDCFLNNSKFDNDTYE